MTSVSLLGVPPALHRSQSQGSGPALSPLHTAPGTASFVRRGGLGVGARQVPAAKWFLLQPSGFNRFPILYLSGWNFPGWGPARRGMFDLERMSMSGLKCRGCRQLSRGSPPCRASCRPHRGSAAGSSPDPDTAPVPLTQRLWLQLGVRGGGGSVWRSPPGSQVGFRQGWLPLGPAQRQEGPLAGAGGSVRWPRSPAQRAHCGPLPTDFSN